MSALLTLLGISRTEIRSEPVGSGSATVPPARSDSRNVTLDTALTLPAVYRAITILSVAVSQLELKVWRGGEELASKPALVRAPDVDQTLSQFLKRTVIGLAGTGNAYWLIIRNGDGMVTSLQVLNPLMISVEYDREGRKQYRYGQNLYAANEVKHLRLLEVPGHTDGLGPIQAARSMLNGALSLRDYSDNWFANGGVPTGVLSSDQQLTPQEANAYKDRWHEMQAERDIAVLGKGLSYAPIILKPEDAQFLETCNFGVTEVARLFGIPAAYMLAEVPGSSSLTYQNVQQVDTQFIRYAAMAYLLEIEDAFSSLLVRGQTAKFDLSGFLRPDAKAQAEIHRLYIDMGAISPGEVRAELGLSGPAPKKPTPSPVAPSQPGPVPPEEPA